MIHSLQKNTNDTYIYRVYDKPNTLRYKGSLPVSYRGNGEFEVHAWNSFYKLWPEGPRDAMPKIMEWIHDELKRTDPRFEKLTGTFEDERLLAYERMFRFWFDLMPIGSIVLNFNGVVASATIVQFVKK